MKPKVVLAYSGGLDTSVILTWLLDEGYEVIAFIANVGQDDDLDAAKQKALACGASKVYVEDLREEFIRDYIYKALKAGTFYEGRYLLGTSLARPLIAKHQIAIAAKESANYVAHGATGKGNDQVRFELSYYTLGENISVIAPWKIKSFLERFKGRPDLLAYAKEKNIPIDFAIKKPPYSMDGNLMHISYEGGILEEPSVAPPTDMFRLTKNPIDCPDKEYLIDINFQNGIPVSVYDHQSKATISGDLELFNYLNQVGGANGVGRIDIVENRYVGIKSRGVYESPGATILWIAHQDLELICLDREVLRLQNYLSTKMADIIYNGYWFAPEMEFITNAIDGSQKRVNGKVSCALYKGQCIIKGRSSENSLYNPNLSSMDKEGGYDQADALGFIRINAIRLKAWESVKQSRNGKTPNDY